ncbi:MAG: short chain dehydrogenase [Cyclobacteriaceae bacterium]
MRILIIGGNGTIGRPVADHLSKAHEVRTAGRSQGDFTVDIADSSSIKQMLEKAGQLDAIVSIAGEAKWADFNDLSEEDYYLGIKSKLMGQVNVARLGKDYISDKGSITLSTGILADDPVVKTASAAMVNGAIHSFVQAAALEMEKGMRLNAVSLGMVEDAYDKYKDYFPGHNPISTEKMINAYLRSILGKGNGQVIRVYD